MITISELYVFPIKSLAGIALESAELTKKGLKYDRRWLLVDKKGVHITQRTHPQLVLFRTSILENGIGVLHEKDDILVPFVPETKKQIIADVWGDQFDVVEVKEQLSKWFSLRLSEEVKLVYQPDNSFRQADQKYAKSLNDDVSAADGFPVLVISEASLEDLNSRLQNPVEMLRFRPNIVLKGLPAFAEDKLNLIKSNDASLLGVKNCGRCIMITNDLKEGKLSKEPLNTLSRYRKEGNKILFGRNFIPQKLGFLKVGDTFVEA